MTSDLKRFLTNWRAERDAVYLYRRLAQAEPNADLQSIYRRLADTEERHARVWEEKLRAAGAALPAVKVSWRIRALGWLAARFGNSFVLPTLAGIERDASAGYDGQAEAEAAGMPRDERSHARIFGVLARSKRGLQGSEVARFEGRHRALGGNALRAGVLGANDGLVSNFSLVMGVAGAQVSGGGILVTGLAGMLAGAISMALGEWLSVQSARELFAHQIGIEKQELEQAPEEEKEELALIYQAKGLPSDEAERLAERLLSDPGSALDTLAREELGVDPDELGGSAWVAAATSFALFAGGAIIPVLPFFFTHGLPGVFWSAGASAGALFFTGAVITLVTGKNPVSAGLRQVLFGMLAAAVTFGLGRLIGVNISG
jgi:vacuolar iron transporter family protein